MLKGNIKAIFGAWGVTGKEISEYAETAPANIGKLTDGSRVPAKRSSVAAAGTDKSEMSRFSAGERWSVRRSAHLIGDMTPAFRRDTALPDFADIAEPCNKQ